MGQNWNTLATPVKLEEANDTWGEFATFNTMSFSAAYSWNGTSFVWVNAADAMTPLNAIYVNMNQSTRVLFDAFDGISAPPSKALASGWNLVGSAFMSPTMPVKDAFVSAYYASGTAWGYSQVVSPGVNQTAWTFVRDSVTIPDMQLGKGYWVFIVNPASCAGFTSTP